MLGISVDLMNVKDWYSRSQDKMAALPPTLPCLAFLLISVCFPFVLTAKCVKLDTCSCKMDDGSGIMSLQALDKKDGVPLLVKEVFHFSLFNFSF